MKTCSTCGRTQPPEGAKAIGREHCRARSASVPGFWDVECLRIALDGANAKMAGLLEELVMTKAELERVRRALANLDPSLAHPGVT